MRYTNYIMKLNISEAARASNKSRKTLYRHMKSGKLSYENDTLGNRVIDVSELHRVYQDIEMGELKSDTVDMSPDTVSMSQSATPSIEALKIRLELVEQQLKLEREEKQRLLAIIESQAESMKQLAPPKNTQKYNWLQRLFSR